MDKSEWTYKTIREVCVPKKEILRAGKYFDVNDEILYIDISSIDNKSQIITETTRYLMSDAPSRAQQCVQCGDILVSTVRPNLKNIAIVNEDKDNLVASSGFCVLRSRIIERNYLFYYLKSDIFTSHLMGLTTGANYPAVKDSDVLDSIIPFPPKSTQQQIIKELNAISQSITMLQQQVNDLDALAQSIFYDMFGDPIENSKNWEIKPLGSICAEKKEIRRASKCIDKTDKILYIDISSVDQKSNLLTGFTTYTYGEAPSRAQQMVKNGDVLISLVRPNLKNIAIVNTKEENMVASSGFCVLRAKDSTNRFIKYFVLTPQFTEYLVKRVSGANYPAVREEDIKNCAIGIPPIPLQQLFETKIATIEDSKSYFNVQIKDMQTLLASRMQYWFE